jgi:glycosyltransferase involved in cell wall biosynthesis
VSQWHGALPPIDVIYNGVEIPTTPATPYDREFDLIVSSGRLVPWKGFRALIDVVARSQSWRLVILGDGPDKSALEEKVRVTHAGGRVTLLGKSGSDARPFSFLIHAMKVCRTRSLKPVPQVHLS